MFLGKLYLTFYSFDAGLWGVVNNAGIEVPGDIELCLVDHFRFCQEVNLNGMIAVTKAVLPMIRRSKGKFDRYTSCTHSCVCECECKTM